MKFASLPALPVSLFIWWTGFQDDCGGRCELEQPDVHMMLGPGSVHLSRESLR